MKRKINRVGASTLTVSLPSKWARQYGLKQGDEIEVSEEGSALQMSTNRESTPHCVEINMHGSWRLKRRYVYNAYRRGFDEILFHFETPKELDEIKDYLDDLIGFEVIEHGENYCKAKSITLPSEMEFENLLRRYFLLLSNMANDCYKELNEGKTGFLENIAKQDKVINKIYLFLTRMINKKRDSLQEPMYLYLMIDNMEEIGDAYRDLCFYYANKKIKFNKQLLLIFKRINDLLRVSYENFYKYDLKKEDFFYYERDKLFDALNNMPDKLQKDEIVFFHWLFDILVRIYNLASPIMAINLKEVFSYNSK
ncbi:MAG TPA: AbrB/MazE/SpoVT family DNA-binding domain-containing protein [Patescibacteria group bacterium]|nr:AbrB/MazE/SpoVT family DNA-binding domain-containing protein [Patescibacteria group bacterium]